MRTPPVHRWGGSVIRNCKGEFLPLDHATRAAQLGGACLGASGPAMGQQLFPDGAEGLGLWLFQQYVAGDD